MVLSVRYVNTISLSFDGADVPINNEQRNKLKMFWITDEPWKLSSILDYVF